MGPRLHRPHRIKLLIGKLKVEGVHHFKATADAGGGEFRGAADLGWADAHPKHVQAVVPGQDPGTAADAATHIQHPTASRQLVEPAPAHQLVHKSLLGLAEVDRTWRVSVMPQVDMLSPEPFQQLVIGPGVVGRGDAV